MRAYWTVVMLAGLVGCPGHSVDHVDTHTLRVDPGTLPERTGDPLVVTSTISRQYDGEDELLCPDPELDIPNSIYGCEPDQSDAALTLLGPDGEVQTEALLDAQGDRWGWTVPEGSPAGIYQIQGVVGLDLSLASPVAFEILDFGEATDFSTADLVGKVFEVDEFSTWPADLGSLIEGSSPRILWTVDSLDGEVASFRIAAESPNALCTVLADDGNLSASTFLWTRDHIEVDHPELGIVQADDMSIEIAWRTGAPNDPDVRVDGTIDLRPFAGLVQGVDNICELFPNFDAQCQVCPDGQEECFDAHANRGRLTLVTDVLPTDLPVCGVSNVDVGDLEFSCDVDWQIADCGCNGPTARAVTPGALLLVAMVAFRRRRRRD